MREQFAWNFAAQAVGLVLPPILIIVLARILEPSDFGMFALLTVVISVIQAVSLSPLGEVIVKSEREDIGDFIFSLQLVVGIVISVALLVGAELVADLFNKPELASPLRVSCLLLLISPLIDTAIRMNMRKIAFKAVFVRRVVSPIANALVSIPLAISGVGYWALVWGQISGFVVAAVVVIAMGGWSPRFNLKFRNFRNDLLFSWQMLLQGATRSVRSQSDKVILGYYFSLDVLGHYHMAGLIAMLPFTSIVGSVSQVMYAALSDKIRRGEEVVEFYLLAQRRVLMITFPLCAIMLINADGLITIIMGVKWLIISDIFIVMTVVGGLYSPLGLNTEVFKAKGRPQIMTRLMIVQAVVSLIVFIWLAPKGVYAASLGFLGLSFVFTPINIFLTLRLLSIGILDYIVYVGLRPTLIVVAIIATSKLAAYLPIDQLHFTMVSVAAGGVIMFIASFYWERDIYTKKRA